MTEPVPEILFSVQKICHRQFKQGISSFFAKFLPCRYADFPKFLRAFRMSSTLNIWQKPIHYSTVGRYTKPGFGFQATVPPLFSTYTCHELQMTCPITRKCQNVVTEYRFVF